MQISVKIENGQVRRSIRNVSEAIPDVNFRNLWRLMKNAVMRLKQYPSPPVGSRYVRTGAYGAGFEAIKIGPMGVRLVNDVDYAPLVGGDSQGLGQAEVHAGRWELISDVVDEEVTQQASQNIEADMQKVVAQQGMGL